MTELEKCFECQHFCMCANQGITWCGLQKEEFGKPDEPCHDFERSPKAITTTNTKEDEIVVIRYQRED